MFKKLHHFENCEVVGSHNPYSPLLGSRSHAHILVSLSLGILNQRKLGQARDLANNRGVLWVIASEYMSNRYMQKCGLVQEKLLIIKAIRI